MNISEANAVNTLVRALTRTPNWDGELPTADQQQSAVDLLLAGAHRRLGAGLQPGQVIITEPS